MSIRNLFVALTASAALVGCVDADSVGDLDTGDRGGKTDDYLYGSCADACGDQSLDGNCYCDDMCDYFGDCCDDKAAVCDASFESFKMSHGGFCPPEYDCSGFIELTADGKLSVDRVQEFPQITHEANVSDEDLQAATAVLTDAALIDLLALEEPPCIMPSGVHEYMSLKVADAEYGNSTTFCDKPSIEAARAFMTDLAEKYLPRPSFERFRISTGGFCPPEYDCSGFVELTADGTLRVDRVQEFPIAVHEATVSAGDLQSAIDVVTLHRLIELLASEDELCDMPSGVHEYMSITLSDGIEHGASTTFCDQPELESAREIMAELARTYLPE